jgi:5-hydroxyisourate hydrolase
MASGADHATFTISTHVLDTETGMPGANIPVTLYRLDVAGAPARMTQAMTDSDGRVRDLLERPLQPGRYRIEVDVARGRERPFFTRFAVDFEIRDTGRSYHIPLLLAPYGMTTYRGS